MRSRLVLYPYGRGFRGGLDDDERRYIDELCRGASSRREQERADQERSQREGEQSTSSQVASE